MYGRARDLLFGRVSLKPFVALIFSRLARAGRQDSVWQSSDIIRAELLSEERLEQWAASIAADHRIATRSISSPELSVRLHENRRVLLRAHAAIARAISQDRAITPAAEWLIDNFHVVEQQIRQIQEDLPRGYYRQLPKLAEGPLRGYPRVFGLAWEFVAHTDSRFDAQLLFQFVQSYQQVQPLTIGELWAVAITLRIVLVENLRRAAQLIASGRAERQLADDVADRLLGFAVSAPQAPEQVLKDLQHTPTGARFAVQLLHRLRDQGDKGAPALAWLDARLASQSTTADTVIRDEHQRQASSNLTVRNVITGMRAISTTDWSEFVESVSLVDSVLREAPTYAEMDFPTRDRYRGAVEELARESALAEFEIANRAVAAANAGISTRERDPGYYLIAGGRRRFAASIGCRPSIRAWPSRVSEAAGIRGYILSLAVVTTAVIAWPLVGLAHAGTHRWVLIVLGLLALVPAVEAAMALVNRSVASWFGAKSLPALELRAGVPAELRTLVVVPTLLSSRESLAQQLERLEIHHMSSLDGDIYFALLTDWIDSSAESAPGDGLLLADAVEGIARLNRLYDSAPGGERFLLLHRRRVWNSVQSQWMGWERKRGKLHELNRLLRGATDTTFVSIDGHAPKVPADVRYIITLDADTRLPRDAVRRLVGKMAHPLNRPRFDARTGRVVEGYAVLQPRVTPSLPMGSEGSMFQRLFSSPSGIDPYSSAVSDVYQDLCSEGSYVGKGIYDVDAFEAALADRVPESSILSHDLFEGIFARAGLVSDIEVVEDYPLRYDVASARSHRWARGDWQLLPWLFGWAMTGKEYGHRSIPLIGRWKMLDNLRRTLLAPSTVLALAFGWCLPMYWALTWTAFLIALLALPTLPPVLAGIIPRRARISKRNHVRALLGDVRVALAQTALLLTLLAHQAALMLDAISRTLFRLLISRRHLLDWTTAAQLQQRSDLSITSFYRLMNGALAIALAVVLLAVSGYARIWLAVPFALWWIVSPLIARKISQSTAVSHRSAITPQDATALRLIARRTWGYFETFVTSADHMFPPDNFQELPRPAIAHRTSPTNLGLYLLSVVTARDFGWIGTLEALERLETTFTQMMRLERFQGHFYNWYDTRDMRPLEPKYISSVDSGNFAAHLITLANACLEMGSQRPPPQQLFAGITDALTITRDNLQRYAEGPGAAICAELAIELDLLAALLLQLEAQDTELGARLSLLQAPAAAAASRAVALAQELASESASETVAWARALQNSIASHLHDLTPYPSEADGTIKARYAVIAQHAQDLSQAMRFDFLVDPERKLLSIGYRVTDSSRDPSCYDLLASEARLTSFLAIAYGDLPARHWFRLGRDVTPVPGGGALVSWSGSMFEYLMPSLVTRAPSGSLLEQTNRLIVHRQETYGRERHVPWGISESAYNARDLELTYQYLSFGVPDLGLKRGLGDNTVVAPYATALAAMIEPHAAALNFTRLVDEGAEGRYGFYEALDYTPDRVPLGRKVAIVRAYMAHHQGMTIVALANTLLNGVMRSRFHREPRIQATELLLQERPPRDVAYAPVRVPDVGPRVKASDLLPTISRSLNSPHDATPRTCLLSNGHYTVMLTAAGSGYSHWRGNAVTRWREDVTCDPWGAYIYLRDVRSGQLWSATFQPTGAEPEEYRVMFNEDRAEFVRHDAGITTTLEVVVSPDSDAEVRRVSVSNMGNRVRDIEITSYAELVLGPAAADNAHQAFSKLFVQTEYLPESGVILARRRRRSPTEPEVWAAHLTVAEGETTAALQIETDRAKFIGRSRELRSPLALTENTSLSGSVGTVLDPIFSCRRRIRVEPRATARLAFWTLVAASRGEVLDLVEKHRDVAAFERALTLAWTQAQVQLRYLGISLNEANLFQRLAGHVIYSDPTLRPRSDTLRRGVGGQSALWTHGLSGDLPIVVVRIDDVDDLDLVRQLIRAFEYWRLKQLAVDLVILNERAPSYTQELQAALEAFARASEAKPTISGSAGLGHVVVLRSDIISSDYRAMLLTASRAVLLSRRGTLAEQVQLLESVPIDEPPVETFGPSLEQPSPSQVTPALEFFNGLGGFAADGQEYVTVLRDGHCTPAPWINVVANPNFGFHVSTEGGGYTWSGNSRDHQLTPWSNDPVTDRPGEVLYLRDDDTGALWGPTALPIRHPTLTYTATHGRGYSRFEHSERGIALELLQFVPLDASVKLSRLTIRNLSDRTRHLSVTAYVEWVLGNSRATSAPYLVTDIDGATGAMLVRNLWVEPSSRVAFLDLAGRQTSWTADRREFLGRNGSLARPAALLGAGRLSGRTGAGADPCGALQCSFEVAPNASFEIVCVLGEADNTPEAQTAIRHWRSANLTDTLARVRAHWDDLLGVLVVKTPDRALDVMLNGWLLYQALACRIWGRSGFYQASGAYGLRDQLQDTMALLIARPALTRAHLLRVASRQFIEGDLQHWWLPESGRGVRTRVSDDCGWLCYGVGHYVEATGDHAILDEVVPFLDGPKLKEGEVDLYFAPAQADESASLYEHCARALDHSLACGAHGLPLMGSGDWNDGMNLVGAAGRGESIWLGWFLYLSLTKFSAIAASRADSAHAQSWQSHAARLQVALEQAGWDGDWYRRGYFDDGVALGSANSAECRIDSIAQSWGVLSGAAPLQRARHAMQQVKQQLVIPDPGLLLLFTPAFDKSVTDPGYIKGYPPGIRENGGQYTHAAVWTVIAFAMLGECDQAAELLSMLNPINHALGPADVARYKVEPYVVAADIYSESPHLGRGGWTWYTGSAAWLYRAGAEWILGCRLQGNHLHLQPRIPKQWPGFEFTLRFGRSHYQVSVDNTHATGGGIRSLQLDGQALSADQSLVPLVDDAQTHRVQVVLG